MKRTLRRTMRILVYRADFALTHFRALLYTHGMRVLQRERIRIFENEYIHLANGC